MVSPALLPLSLVIPTRNRAAILHRTLADIGRQSAQPEEIIVVHAADDLDTCVASPELHAKVVHRRAATVGAASQRNEGLAACRCPVIGFFDDDIRLEPDCIARLWRALQSDSSLGGVNAMIVNQRYHRPGALSRIVFRLMAGRPLETYAGRVLGPAVNLLPEDRDDLPEVVPVDWLNTTCALYRREALPNPPFPGHFSGYSLGEDLALSLAVGKSWKLANARTARIYHDSQQGQHKADAVGRAEMELVNRHYVMTRVLGRRSAMSYAQLALWEGFQLTAELLQARGGAPFWRSLRGKLRGARVIASGLRAPRAATVRADAR
jgi:glycosyltransferase involved in cell wall biosynthesis